MKRVQLLRHNPEDALTFQGLEGELTVELSTFLIRVHDGVTPGGFATLTEAVARALFLTNEDFQTEIDTIIENLNTINAAAEAAILGSVLVSRGPVLDILTAPPGSPATGARYLVAHSGTSGAFVGFEDQVIQYTSNTEFAASGTPLTNAQVFVDSDNTMRYFTGSAWSTTNPDVTLDTELTAIATALALKAPLASPALTGTPTAPTAAPGTDNTQVATTAYVDAAVALSGAPSVASEAEMETGTADNRIVTPTKIKYSDFGLKGWVTFNYAGSVLTVTAHTDTVASVTRVATGHYTVTMTGGLNFVHGFAIANGSGTTHPGGAGAIGMGVSFTGTDPNFDVRFGDAGGSGGEVSDPATDVCVLIFGNTQN